MAILRGLVVLTASYFLLLCAWLQVSHAQQVTKPVDYSLTTLFGGFLGDGVIASSVGMDTPYHVAVYPINGHVYYADQNNNQIRYVDSNGLSHVLAGDPNYVRRTSIKYGLTLANDSIGQPMGISINSKGEVFFTELNTGCVRKVFYNSTIQVHQVITIAGGGTSTGNNINPLSAKLNYPTCVVVSPNDEIYICDNGNNLIRKIVNSTMYNVASVSLPKGLAFHPLTSELYYLDFIVGIRKIATNGTVYTVSSTYTATGGLAFSSKGDLYFSALNSIYKMNESALEKIANRDETCGFSGDGGDALNSQLCDPNGMVGYGNNLLIAETKNNRIRKINLDSNIIETFAGDGSKRFIGGLSGKSSSIALVSPESTFYNSQTDELLVADSGRNIVLRLNSLSNYTNSLVETIIGNGIALNDTVGKLANQTALYLPYSVVQDEKHGDIYVASNNRVLKVANTSNIVSHIAGSLSTLTGDSNTAIMAQFKYPTGIDISSNGEMYIVDSQNFVIRKIDKDGIISTVAGTGKSGHKDGAASDAMFIDPFAIVCTPNGFLVSDRLGHRIRKYNALNGTVETIAGKGTVGYENGPLLATDAQLNNPTGIWYNSITEEILVADFYNNRIRKINSTGYISTIGGTNDFDYKGDGRLATETKIAAYGLAVHPLSGEIYYSESNSIRKINSSGFVETIYQLPSKDETPFIRFSTTGDLYVSFSSFIKKINNGTKSVINFFGSSDSGIFSQDIDYLSTNSSKPTGIVIAGGSIIFSDAKFGRIRNITSGIVKTIAGGIGDGYIATNVNLGSIYSLAFNDIYVYFYDSNSYRIRRVSVVRGVIDSLVGGFANSDNGDLLAYQTNINNVNDMRILKGEITFADSNNYKIRKASFSGYGEVLTIAGIGNFSSTVDNVKATNAYLNVPKSVAYLPNGEMIIAESNSHIIRKVNSNGIISIIAGKMLQSGFTGDNSNSKNALLYSPKGLSVLKDGRIIFSDLGNTRIRMLTPYCSDSSYTMINYTCVKNITSDTISNNDFSVLGISKYQIVKSSLVEFSLVVSKLDINQTVLSTVLNSNSYTMSYSIQSALFSKNGTVNDFVLKNPQTNVADLFPSVILDNKFTIDYTKLSSSFNTTIAIKITASNGNSIYSTFNLPFHLPPSFTTLLDITSNSSGIAIKNNFTANLTPWSGNSDLYPLKYAIGFTTPTRDLIRITEFSESLNQEFALPYLNETIGLTVMVMDSLGNVYSNSSNNEVKVYPFDGSESEYYQLSQQLTSFNYLTCFIHDKSFKTNSNEYLKNLLTNLNVKTSDISTVIENIQQITMKSTFDEEIANQTISKLSELVQYRLETANKTKLEIGYVTSTISDDNVNSILKISSETFTTGLEIESPRKLTQNLANLIITGQIAQSVQSSNFTTYTSQNINMTVSSFVIKSTSTNQTQQIDQSQVSLSFDSAKIASQYSALSSECAISLLTYTNLFGNSQQKENETSLISSNSISITTDFKFMKDQKVLNLENLQQPIVIKFKLSSSENQEIAKSLSDSSNETLYYNLTCNYLDETSGIWRKDGCWFSGYDQTSGTIQCSCNHTTLFTTFLEQKTLVLSSQTIVQLSSMYYAQIAFGIFYLILSSVVLISLIIFRKSQPIASRLITPYLGLIALILETSLIYIVQRSVLVSQFSKSSTDWTSGDLASNWIANIVMIIVNTMQLTAILAYVMQVSRFELMKYLYNIMMEVRRRNKTSSLFSFLRVLTSKKLFIGTLTIFALINIVYWTLWVILVRTGVISQKDYSFIISISYIVIILSLGSIIVLISICDWTFSSIMKLINNKKSLSSTSSIKNNNTSTSQLKLNSEENEKANKYTDSLEKLKHEIHTMNFVKKLISLDTPLFFRMEMILFCLSFIMLVINQALGMSTLSSRYLDEVSYLKVLTNDMISFIFELIYMALHILVFGGFCLSVLLITKFRKSLRTHKSENNLDEENREMIEMISNEYGQSLFEDFCKKEFSTENLYLYQDLQQLKSKSEISQIYVKFIQSGSDMEVNIPSDCKKKLTTIYNNLQTSTQLEMQEKSTKDNLDEETNEVIQILQDNIIVNLSDSFSRFVLTSEYELYSEAFELKQNIAKQLNVL